MFPELETERLLLHPLELRYHEQVQLLFPKCEIVQCINNRVPWPYPPDGVYTYYSEVALPAMERGEA